MKKRKPLGRPKTLVDAKLRHISLEAWQWEALDKEAKERGYSVSALLRQIVTERLGGER